MSTAKLDWKKAEKAYYGPGTSPEEVEVPAFGFFMIDGQGSPDDAAFGQAVEALYAAAYAIRMSPKQGRQPAGYQEYTVYPLEGVWDLVGASRAAAEWAERERRPAPTFDKADLAYTLMIHQPAFVTEDYAESVLAELVTKKKQPALARVRFEVLTEGRCLQLLHVGAFADEPASFRQMADFCRKHSLARIGHRHREIYLSDPRRTAPDRLKTILRFPIRDDYKCD